MTRMSLTRRLAVAAVAILFFSQSGAVWAQFSGRFGKNKFAYQSFDWHVYRSPHFDIYYYPEEEQFLEQVISYAESSYLYLTKALDHEPKFRIPFIFYKNHGDFEQTNVSLQFIPESVGAFAEPLENRMVLPVDLPPDELYSLLTHELTHIFTFSILYQDSAGRALRGAPPLWLTEGLASHMAHDEDSFDRMIIRDAVVNGLVPPITQVRGLSFLTYRYGQAAFDFIEREFGAEGIRSLLLEYRKVLLTANIEKSIKETFGIESEEFDRRFRRYLMKKYIPILLENKEPEDYGKEIGIKLPGVFTFSPALSPSGELIAVMTNKQEDLDVIILNADDGEVIRNLTKGFTNDYDYLTASITEGKNDLSWSPGGDEVAVFARKGNKRLLLLYNAVTGKRVLKQAIDVDEADSPAFAPDGERITFSANKNGQVDIFEYNLKTGDLSNITNDSFHDSNPSWSSDGKTILYNRRINAYEKIFLLDYDDPAQKTQVTFGETTDIQPSFSRDGKRIYYSSDAGQNNIFNIYSLDLETGEIRQYTDIISGHFGPRELPEEDGKTRLVATAYWRGRYRLYNVDLDEPVSVISPEERSQEPVEIVPFQSSLQLTVDQQEKSRYDDLQFHLETTPVVAVGVANDGTVFGGAFLLFSDLLGDHRFWVNAQSISSFTNLDTGYINLKHRTQWFVSASDYRDFVVLPTSSGRFEREQANRVTSGSGGLIFPFSQSTRFQGTIGVTNRDIISTDLFPVVDPNTGEEFGLLDTDFRSGTSPYASVSLVNDTTRYKSFGPWHGKRLNLTVTSLPSSSGDLGSYTSYLLDMRTYRKLTSRSTLAWRIYTNVGTGEGAQFFGIGGFNQIRGFRFREFFGDSAAYMNVELRFPLMRMQWPAGRAVREIRGLAFFDIGASWTQDGLFWDKELGFFRDFQFYDSDENRLQDGRASYGFGVSMRLGGLDLNWTFAHRLPYTETSPDTACINAFLGSGTLEGQVLALAGCPRLEVDDAGFRSDFYIGIPF